MATLQVKGMDDQLYKALAARARQEHRSISQQAVTIIKEYLGSQPTSLRRANAAYLQLCGSWQDERSAEEIVSEIRQSRRSGRRTAMLCDVLD